ncbi:hypothetical protein ACNHUS_22740 [Actinomycetes bacterium M1A6_2h]
MSPTDVLDVDSGTYARASTACDVAGGALYTALTELRTALDGVGSMAGSDAGGRDWGSGYDTAARSLFAGTHTTVSALTNYGNLLARAAANHEAAEADAARLPRPHEKDPQAAPRPPVPVPVSAVGDSGPGLQGAIDLASAVGVPCPNGDVDKLSRAVSAWTTFARAVGDVRVGVLDASGNMFGSIMSPEIGSIYRELRLIADACERLRADAGVLASSCRDFASQLGELRGRIKSLIEDFAIEEAASIAVGIGLAAVTAGLSAAASAAIAAGRFTMTANRVRRIIDDVREALGLHRLTDRAMSSRRSMDDLTEIADRPAVDLDGALIPKAPTVDRIPGQRWGDPASLDDHFARHGTDFGARSAQEYAQMATEFSERTDLPRKVTPDGTIRIYDPSTNTFGAYNADGTTKTFFTPGSGADYWERQPGSAPR